MFCRQLRLPYSKSNVPVCVAMPLTLPPLFCAGYFTSRPASKGYIRSATSYLQAARQLEAFMGLPAVEGGA